MGFQIFIKIVFGCQLVRILDMIDDLVRLKVNIIDRVRLEDPFEIEKM